MSVVDKTSPYGAAVDYSLPVNSLGREERDQTRDNQEGNRGLGSRLGSFLAKLAVIGKALLLLLPKIKFFGFFISALTSLVVYTSLFGWQFALGFMLLLFTHEMGHIIQLKREGIHASAPYFIPFLGAIVSMKDHLHNAAMEARVGIAGPILGTVGTSVPAIIALSGGGSLWVGLAYVGCVLNLFNLIPLTPFDGGRVAAALSPKIWIGGFVAMVGVGLLTVNPLILVFAVVGGLNARGRLKNIKAGNNPDYYTISPKTKLIMTLLYIFLILILGLGVGYFYHAHPIR